MTDQDMDLYTTFNNRFLMNKEDRTDLLFEQL